MRRLAKCLVIAVVTCLGFHTTTCLADESTIRSVDDARAIYGAFLTQWIGKQDVPTNVANTAEEPSQEDIGQYNKCASGWRGGSVHWTTGTTDADLKSALASLARVRLVDAKQWQAADPGNLIARGQSVDAAVGAGFAAGLMTLSAISFNEAHDIAMFNFSFVCGGLCGHGGIVMFNKTSNGWVQSKKRCGSWVS